MEMGKAISQKIREAIRAKLIDLGNYVDEELPDYIMVMIANKKTEEQMKDDLALFLGANAEKFCGWLQGVLKKLQAARDEQKERKEKAKDKKKKSKKKDDRKEKKHRTSSETKADDKAEGSGASGSKDAVEPAAENTASAEKDQSKDKEPMGASQKPTNSAPKASTEAAASSEPVQTPLPSSSQPVISLVPDTNDFLDEEIKMNEAVKKPVAADSEKSPHAKTKGKIQSGTSQVSPKENKEVTKVSLKTAAKERSPDFTVTIRGGSSRVQAMVRPETVPVKGSVKSRLGTAPAIKRKAEIKERPKTYSTLSTVVRVPNETVKHPGPASVIGQVIEGNDEDSDEEPAVKRIASTVKPRRRQPMPKTKQNSMTLLKKAMTQAQESTSMFPAAGQFTEARRMIVKSSSQSGTMKIVARSIPADKESPGKRHAAPKKMFAAAVKATSSKEAAPRPSPKASVSVRPLGLMSRSRFKEAKERDFDAHSYQRVEKGSDEEEEDEQKEKEEEEEEEQTEAVEEDEGDKEEDGNVEEEAQDVESAEDSQEESVEDNDDQRQIIDTTKAVKSEPVVMEPEEEEEEEGEMVHMEELVEEEDDDAEIQVQEHVYDTRNTTIVRPLQLDRITAAQKREPPAQVYHQLPPASPEDSPRFIVTMEGKKRRPPFRRDSFDTPTPGPTVPHLPQYSPTPISRLDLNKQSLLPSHYQPSDEMEMEALEEKSFDYEPTHLMQFKHVIVKERSPLMEKEIPMKRVGPTEPQFVKESLYSPPQPQIEPVTFSLQESDDEHGHAEMDEKVNERCKYWPACKNGSDCPYFHPSTPCRTFPNCKFGDKCLFIHPNCKFDAMCMNPNCPYTHATRTKPAPVIIQAPPISAFPTFKQASASRTVCKFHPHCSNPRCPFFHPVQKMCRYNRSCTRPDCKFQHSHVVGRSAMKWTKDQHISERKFASKSLTST